MSLNPRTRRLAVWASRAGFSKLLARSRGSEKSGPLRPVCTFGLPGGRTRTKQLVHLAVAVELHPCNEIRAGLDLGSGPMVTGTVANWVDLSSDASACQTSEPAKAL